MSLGLGSHLSSLLSFSWYQPGSARSLGVSDSLGCASISSVYGVLVVGINSLATEYLNDA